MQAENDQKHSKKEFLAILKRIKKDSEDGLRIFYERYGKLITCTARLYCRNDFELREIVNEVLIKIWRNADRFGEIANPEGWIYVITSNFAKSLLKKRCYVPLEETVADEKDGIQEFIDRDSFYFMIKDLSETERQVITHKFASRLTFEDIGKMLGKSTSTVSSIFYRAIEKIKEKTGKNL